MTMNRVSGLNNPYNHFLSKRYYYLSDHLGSIRVLLNEQGNVDSWSDYYPFGKESRGSSTSNEPKEQFTGKERDVEIGLDYFGARYYNADIGRWISVDPLSQERAWISPYNYSQNNPILRNDPNGKLDTKYVNEKGETLYETDDKLNDVIVVKDGKLDEFEEKLNELNKEKKLNDPDANKEQLHVLGVEVLKLDEQYESGSGPADLGFQAGYSVSYESTNTFSKLSKDISFFSQAFASPKSGQFLGGYYCGRKKGSAHKEQEKMNVFADPYKQLKNNAPLIKLK